MEGLPVALLVPTGELLRVMKKDGVHGAAPTALSAVLDSGLNTILVSKKPQIAFHPFPPS